MDATLRMRSTRWSAIVHAVLYWTITVSLLTAAFGAAVAGVGLKHACIY